MITDLRFHLDAIERAVAKTEPGDVPALVGELERLKTACLVRVASAPPPPTTPLPDELLTVGQAARRLGVSKDWLYRRSRRLPFAVRVGRKALRFSGDGLARWVRTRSRE